MEEINGWKLKKGSNKTYTKNGITAVIFEDNHHIYKLAKRADGQILRNKIWS